MKADAEETKSLLKHLAKRYRARQTIHRRVPWKGFTLSALNVVAIAFFVFDRPLGQAAKSISPPLVSIAGDVTDIGRIAWILAALAGITVCVYALRHRLFKIRPKFRFAYFGRMIAYVFASVAAATLIANPLKFLIGRARPLLYEQVGVFSFQPFSLDFLHQSFPSGHSSNIGALFTALALLFPRYRLLFIGIGLWMGATRVIIGVHYPSDVAAGLALGGWLAFAVSVLFARLGYVFSIGRDGWPQPRLARVLR